MAEAENISLVESFTISKSDSEKSADVIFAGPHVFGVADGTTAKSWEGNACPTGVEISTEVGRLLQSVSSSSTALEAVTRISNSIWEYLADSEIQPGYGPAATFALVNIQKREVWRVGDISVLIDGTAYPPNRTAEDIVARGRSLVLREHLQHGIPISELQRNDLGRASVQYLFPALVGLRNKTAFGLSYGAIDGQQIPPEFIEVFKLPAAKCEVVLATDGYPDPFPTLRDSEIALARRISEDPLMISEPPMTKGVSTGARSFDDRAYVRVKLKAFE